MIFKQEIEEGDSVSPDTLLLISKIAKNFTEKNLSENVDNDDYKMSMK